VVDRTQIVLEKLRTPPPRACAQSAVLERQQAFGYSQEDISSDDAEAATGEKPRARWQPTPRSGAVGPATADSPIQQNFPSHTTSADIHPESWMSLVSIIGRGRTCSTCRHGLDKRLEVRHRS